MAEADSKRWGSNGLDFERSIIELENQIDALKRFSSGENIDIAAQIKSLEKRLEEEKKRVFSSLTAWQRVQVARHPSRPHTIDYIKLIAEEFVELYGDRCFGDDKAVVGGLATIDGRRIMLVGQERGTDTNEKVRRNFGMPHPEGYRKGIRLMRVAEKFGLPVVCLLDTTGAYPGLGAEERGQGEAIAYNLQQMSRLRTPVIVVVVGEGGSGGALAFGMGDRIYMLEYAIYSVCSPEACASILWRDAGKAEEAASALKLTAADLLEQGLIDGIIPEPLGGAHRDPNETVRRVKEKLSKALAELETVDIGEIVARRYEKFRRIGQFSDANA
ncbi:MAG: acetyl-CoA carboxylase carboxyltransferase subunit alpha [Candidatus Hydrogenedentes bacterium]|nr:acetyl-CoA carboxylase carboxyltransferase subunit alpha [Candidatus Hydrogenedentota bacterium]